MALINIILRIFCDRKKNEYHIHILLISLIKDKSRELNNDKEKAFREKEGFQREIQTVLADRDHALHELRTLKQRLESAEREREQFSKRCESQVRQLETVKQESAAAKKERLEAMVYRDKILKECFDVKKSFEQLSAGDMMKATSLKEKYLLLSKQLTSAWNTTEVAMARRDWAFQQRDSVIIRSHEERERSIKEKASLERQLRKAGGELEAAQRRLAEVHRENQTLRKTLLHHKSSSLLHSQDSAIDTESPVSFSYLLIYII